MIHLFPSSSLDNSILTSVLVGLLIVWALQETLGWNFTGLVVPGYLASIFVIHPLTGAVVAAEALLTWAAVEITSDRLPRWWPWAPIFGRERFLLFLLVSVGIRIALEGGGFALLGESFGLSVQEELHSMGLVVVPLAANSLWRSGPGALHRLGIPVFLTWCVLHFVLLPYTNLSLSSFELTYEDLALDFVSSPRAYILLLCGAALGSVVNQRWGWDFGGIIVPGLLALCWLEPMRIASTLVEAGLLAVVLAQLLRLPWIRTANLTGGRPMVLGYTVAYLLKLGLGWALAGKLTGFALNDVFGFGYLLSTIIALRILRHGDPLRAVIPALLTSFAAFVGGTAVGYALVVWMPSGAATDVRDPPATSEDALQALLESAWRNEGPRPSGTSVIATAHTPAIVRGGDGFGGLLVRATGTELVVTGQVGAPLEGPAALAVATALDARVVLLCAAEGRACASARSELAAVLPMLHVTAGDTAELRAAGRLGEGVDLGRLGTLVGGFRAASVASEVPWDTLVLDLPGRTRATATGLGGAPTGLDDRRGLPADEDPLATLADPGLLGLFRVEILRPWMDWRARAPLDEDALVAVTGLARRLGLEVSSNGDVSTLEGPGFLVRLDRAGGPLLVQVPDAREQPGALAVGRALLRTLGASALVVATPDAWTHEGDERGSWVHTALLTVLEEAGVHAGVVTVRKAPDIFDPGGDVVLSVGRPASADRPLPDLARELGEQMSAVGFRVTTYDGGAQRLPFYDPDNAARAAAAASGREAQVTVWITDAVERRVVPVDADHPLEGPLAVAGLPTRTWDLRTLASQVTPGPPGPEWSVAVAALDLFARTGRSGALRPVARDAARVCDPLLGCRWIAVERCGDTECAGILLPLDRGGRGVPSATRTDALTFGGSDLAYVRPWSGG